MSIFDDMKRPAETDYLCVNYWGSGQGISLDIPWTSGSGRTGDEVEQILETPWTQGNRPLSGWGF